MSSTGLDSDRNRTPFDRAAGAAPGVFNSIKGELTSAYNWASKNAPDVTYWVTFGLAGLLGYKVLDVVRERMGMTSGIFGTLTWLLALGGAFWAAKEGAAVQHRYSQKLIDGTSAAFNDSSSPGQPEQKTQKPEQEAQEIEETDEGPPKTQAPEFFAR